MNEFIKRNKFLGIILIITVIIYILLKIIGIQLCVVQSGSMEPTIPTYSLCVVDTKTDYSALKKGDIIVYKKYDNTLIIHRIISISDEGIITKGDNNKNSDGLSVNSENYYALYVWHIPFLGNIINALRSSIGFSLAFILITIIIVTDIYEKKKKNKITKQTNNGLD